MKSFGSTLDRAGSSMGSLFDNQASGLWTTKKKGFWSNLSNSIATGLSSGIKKAGKSYEDTGKVFGVSASTVHRWVRQYEETGDLSNKPLNRSFKKIDPEKLKAYVAEHPDDTQQEVATVFGCCNQAISQAYRRLGITRKKRHSVIKNRAKKK